MTTSDDLVALLHKQCLKAGSQYKFARLHDINRLVISQILTGRRKMSRTVARALGYELAWVKRKTNTNFNKGE